MVKRGEASRNALVRSIEVRDCGHAPALMSDAQISVVEEFLLEKPAGKSPRNRASA